MDRHEKDNIGITDAIPLVAITLPLEVVEDLVEIANYHRYSHRSLAIAEREIAQVKEMVGK